MYFRSYDSWTKSFQEETIKTEKWVFRHQLNLINRRFELRTDLYMFTNLHLSNIKRYGTDSHHIPYIGPLATWKFDLKFLGKKMIVTTISLSNSQWSVGIVINSVNEKIIIVSRTVDSQSILLFIDLIWYRLLQTFLFYNNPLTNRSGRLVRG